MMEVAQTSSYTSSIFNNSEMVSKFWNDTFKSEIGIVAVFYVL